MEIIELSITAEESENYRKITNRLKVLGAVGWVKAYIWAVVYVVIFCAIGFALAGRYALTIMQYVPVGMAVVFCSCMDGISYKKIW
ncbi:MAG: hypothetical protein ACLS9K_00240 [Lachnospira eligens]